MIAAFRKFFCLGILLTICNSLVCGQNKENGSKWNKKVVFITEDVFDQLPDTFFFLQPVYQNYYQTKEPLLIKYYVKETTKLTFRNNLSTGTYHVCMHKPTVDTILAKNILENPGVIQIVKRDTNDYVGLLEEMIHVPFVMPPRLLYQGHQTDLRLAVDCAELAIYGKRRQGYNIPYCGPKKIVDYLNETYSIKRGTVINFGFQISVVYKDKGIIGKLDSQDLLIHAYKDKVEIISFENTDLNGRIYKMYEWK